MAQYPLINGLRFDYSSVEIAVGSATIVGVSELSYSSKLEPGKVRGTSAQVNGRTRGQYEAEGSMTLFKQEADELLALLGPGFMEVAFPVTVHYAESGQPLITDRLIGARIKSMENSHKEGSDALTVKFDLDLIAIVHNGLAPITGLVV